MRSSLLERIMADIQAQRMGCRIKRTYKPDTLTHKDVYGQDKLTEVIRSQPHQG